MGDCDLFTRTAACLVHNSSRPRPLTADFPNNFTSTFNNNIQNLYAGSSRITSPGSNTIGPNTTDNGVIEDGENIWIYIIRIHVSLHACGVATDIVIDKCLLSEASLISSPCCYGSINTTESISYPRSKVFRDIPISSQELLLVAHAAEQTNWDFENENYKRGKLCMSIVDADRSNYIKEHRYQVHLCSLTPATCSPKNNLLVGISENHQQGHCFFQFNGKKIDV